eukprot:9097069-Alexandrium_andersonii.AAC.1
MKKGQTHIYYVDTRDCSESVKALPRIRDLEKRGIDTLIPRDDHTGIIEKLGEFEGLTFMHA